MSLSKPLSSLNAEELKEIISHISPQRYEPAELSKNSEHLVSLLAQLNAKHTYKFMKSIDSLYPGMSFHYVMEARTKCDSKDQRLFLFRISYFMSAFPEKEIFSPMRKRLIQGLLFDEEITTSFFKELATTLNHIETLTHLNKVQKKLMKKNISDTFFVRYLELEKQKIKDNSLD